MVAHTENLLNVQLQGALSVNISRLEKSTTLMQPQVLRPESEKN